jgi:hypothetical protein
LFSDSDDEGEVKKKAFVPEWATDLEKLLKTQRHRNPEYIFGEYFVTVFNSFSVPVMVLEEVFEGSSGASKKLKHRSSSATWSGVDALTKEEDVKYKKRMGYK